MWSQIMTRRWLLLMVLVAAGCQTGTRDQTAYDAGKRDMYDTYKDKRSDTRRGGGWYLQPPTDY
jgi:hypothetical protein